MSININNRLIARKFMQEFQGRSKQKPFVLLPPREKYKPKQFTLTQKEKKTNFFESYYKTIFERSLDGIVVINEKGMVVDFNQAFIDMLGYKPKELKKSGLRNLTPEIYSYLDRKAYRQLLKSGSFKEYEKELTKKDGTRIQVSLGGAIIISNDNGRRWHIFAIIRDLSDRKRIEEQLLVNKRAIDAANDGILITNAYKPNNPIIYANTAFYSTTRYTPKSIRGGNIHILEGKKTNTGTKKDIRSALQNGRYFACEILHYKRDKTTFWNEITLSPVYDSDDKLSNYIMIQKEITERKKFELELIKAKNKAEQSDKVKSLFLANMSHEIRTPLNTILGFTELIEETTRHMVSEEEKKFFNVIRTSGERLMHTVHEILDISQIEAGTYDFKPEELDLYNLVSAIVYTCKPLAEQKGLKLTVVTDIDSAYIKADKNGINQAISNIIDNAIKYTDGGKITISLKQKANHYVLTVEDTGIGIAEEYIESMFEAFSQESEGYTKKFQGIGLGMAIAKRQLDLNHVDIIVESTKGIGTSFTLTFKPVKKRIREKLLEKEETKVTPIAKFDEKPLVLLVEDDLGSQKLTEFFLKGTHDMCFAVSVKEAKQRLKKHPVDLVLLDLSLIGDEDGLDLVRWMRKTKTCKKTPVIATTAHAFTKDRDNCMAAGCNDYLSKPIKRENLLEKISKFI